MKIPKDELRQLNRFFFAVLETVSNEYGTAPGLILNRHKKSRRGGCDVVGARHALATTLRAYVQQICEGSSADRTCRFVYHRHGLPAGVKPISFPRLAEWLGVDHSTLVVGSHRAEDARVFGFPENFLDGDVEIFPGIAKRFLPTTSSQTVILPALDTR